MVQKIERKGEKKEEKEEKGLLLGVRGTNLWASGFCLEKLSTPAQLHRSISGGVLDKRKDQERTENRWD